MTDYLVLKQMTSPPTGQASDWTPVVIARGLEDNEEAEAVPQGYTGDGRYKAVVWPEALGSEFDLAPPGPPAATPVTAEPSED